ncbi:MAG: hypothetical protein Kow0031_38360 [Anaerolineae bacterium]
MNLFSRFAPIVGPVAVLAVWLAASLPAALAHTGPAAVITGVITSTAISLQGNPTTLESPPSFGAEPLNSPANGSTLTDPRPAFDWDDAGGSVLTYTLLITTPGGGVITRTTATSAYTPTFSLPGNGLYRWTVQAANSAGGSGTVAPYTFTLNATWRVFLPVVQKAPTCPKSSGNLYDLIPFLGPAADRPGPEHADLNLALRGYSETTAPMVLVDYNGSTDPAAPQLAGILNGYPGITKVFRVNDWIWQSYPSPGYRGGPITKYAVTLMEMPAAFGTPLSFPRRGPEIYGGGYKAMVLYAEETRLTLGYTRDDTVASGYAVHLEDICVDPNLLALYRAQTDSAGWHVTGQLPALKDNQLIGTAFLSGVRVAIRDRGSFMDPRSQKDWWVGYSVGLEIQQSHDTSSK